MHDRGSFKTRNIFAASMGVTRKVVLALAMIAISTIQLQSSEINSIFTRENSDQNERPELVPLQNQEFWLIVPMNFNYYEDTSSEDVLLSELREIMEGEDGAAAYLRQLVLEGPELQYSISDSYPTYPIDYYGSDNLERDSLVQNLLVSSINSINSDLVRHGLNGDGVIDRVLFLHGQNHRKQEVVQILYGLIFLIWMKR